MEIFFWNEFPENYISRIRLRFRELHGKFVWELCSWKCKCLPLVQQFSRVTSIGSLPSENPADPECTAVTGIRLRMRMRILTRPTTSQKKYRNTPPICIAIRLQFVLQYIWCPYALRKRETLSVLPPVVLQYAPHLYCNTPPICIAVLLGKSWWLQSPGCSPFKSPNLKQKAANQPLRRNLLANVSRMKLRKCSLTLQSLLFFSDLPCFFVRFSFLFQGFWGFGEEKTLVFFRGFPLFFSKKARVGGSGLSSLRKVLASGRLRQNSLAIANALALSWCTQRRIPENPRKETPAEPLWETSFFLGEPRRGLCPSDGDPQEL